MTENGTDTLTDAVNKSIRASEQVGALDTERNAAPIAALRRLARLMDRDEWPSVDGRFDNVSMGTFLRYCDGLGLNPVMGGAGKIRPAGRLAELRSIDDDRRNRTM